MNVGFRALKRFAISREPRCQVCAAPIGEPHPHLVELEHRTLTCACRACAILFRDGNGRWRTVPDRVLIDERFSDADFAALAIPVRLAFLVKHAGTWEMLFPSPGGLVQAELADPNALARAAPLAEKVELEVEALLLHRPKSGAAECLLVPLDVCHELTSQIGKRWRGFSGGDEAERAIDECLQRLRARGATKR